MFRSPAVRDAGHVFEQDAKPTFVVWIFPVTSDSPEVAVQRAITVSDRRWEMCNIKSTGLLLNVLAKQAAAEANADEAIFVRDGVVTEGASTNFFGVVGPTVFTHPHGAHILSGMHAYGRPRVAREAGRLGRGATHLRRAAAAPQ